MKGEYIMKRYSKIISTTIALLAAFIMALPMNAAAAAAKETGSFTLTEAAKKISSCKITVASSVAYTGKVLTPKVTVKYGNTTLKKGTHYTVKYSSNKAIGTAKITITGIKKNGYTGTKTVSFKIVPGKPTVKATTTTNSVTLTWGKVKGATKYVVYKYDSSKKKYTKIATVTGTKYTVKKLSGGKTYSYAVKSYAVKNNKTYAGMTSSIKKVATKPAKVTSLKASLTSNSVTLTWKKVSGATGYTVYKYDASTKKYTKVKSTTSLKYTIKSLKASTTYKYAVAAYTKVGKTAYYGAKSSVVTVKTAAAATSPLATAEGCYKTFRSGTFSIKLSGIKFDDVEDIDATVYMKNKNIVLDMVLNMPMEDDEGKVTNLELNTKMLYLSNKKKGYVLMEVMGLKFYETMTEAEYKETGMDSATMIDSMAPERDTSVAIKKSTKTVDKVKYNCETYTTKTGGTVTYYFHNDKLAIVETKGANGETASMPVSNLCATVSDNIFKLPTAFPLGWLDISTLE